MKRVVGAAIGALFIGIAWLAAGGPPASATVIGIPGNPRQISSPGNPFVGNELEFWVGGVAGLHSPTPEPGVLVLWGTTALGLGVVARRRHARGAPLA